jgi:hypothetical protein
MPFGFRYLKMPPTSFVIQYVNGQPRRSGLGLSFFYLPMNSVIVSVPVSSVDVPFVFNEISADFQSVTIQGQLTYRVTDAARLSKLLDFSINSAGAYVSEDPKKTRRTPRRPDPGPGQRHHPSHGPAPGAGRV